MIHLTQNLDNQKIANLSTGVSLQWTIGIQDRYLTSSQTFGQDGKREMYVSFTGVPRRTAPPTRDGIIDPF
jgi:hypothetical protein